MQESPMEPTELFVGRVLCSPINNRTNSSEVNLLGLEELNGEKYSKYFDEKFILFLEDR
jgi:hypothetical protein